MENKRILFERYLKGECTAGELQQLLGYFEGADISELESKIRQSLEENDTAGTDPDYMAAMLARNGARLHAAILQQHSTQVERPAVGIKRWWIGTAAAVLLCVCAVGLYIQREQPLKDEAAQQQLTDVEPGRDKAVLIIDGGQQLELDGKAKTIVNKNGAISYADGSLVTELDKPRMVTLRTPRAGQYQATLPDGSNVWLNAGSEITYPSQFDKSERRLSMRGEIYLEVAKESARPFVLESEGQRLEVLGTHFNVNAYRDNGNTLTTLVEGKVRVVQTASGGEVIVNPGQQVQNPQQGAMKVNRVDVEEVLSWKEGMYILQEETIGAFAKQIERWYDVEVDLDSYADRRLSAIIPRTAKLSTVLDAITLKTGVKFKIEGRRVTAIEK